MQTLTSTISVLIPTDEINWLNSTKNGSSAFMFQLAGQTGQKLLLFPPNTNVTYLKLYHTM